MARRIRMQSLGIYYVDPIAEKRRHQAISHRRQNHAPLVQYVKAKLRQGWPPATIACRFRAYFPQDERMRINHETICRWVLLDAEQAGTLFRYLRYRHKRCGREKRYGVGYHIIPRRIGIE